jgi:transcriptional regulator with XRE-family HTH domain
MTFQEALRKARGDTSQAAIADLIGVKQSTISSWESDEAGTQCLPAAHRLEKIAAAYKLPAERLRKLWMAAVSSRAAA